MMNIDMIIMLVNFAALKKIQHLDFTEKKVMIVLQQDNFSLMFSFHSTKIKFLILNFAIML